MIRIRPQFPLSGSIYQSSVYFSKGIPTWNFRVITNIPQKYWKHWSLLDEKGFLDAFDLTVENLLVLSRQADVETGISNIAIFAFCNFCFLFRVKFFQLNKNAWI